MPVLRVYPHAATAGAGSRGWSNLSNALGAETAAWASVNAGSGTPIATLTLGAWRDAAGVAIADALPGSAMIDAVSFAVSARVGSGGLAAAFSYPRATGGTRSVEYEPQFGAAFSWSAFNDLTGTAQPGSAFNDLTGTAQPALAAADFAVAWRPIPSVLSAAIDLRALYFDITYTVPRYLVINGEKPAALSLGATPVTEAWLNGLRVWP